ncbi:endonuclease [Vibrio phage K367 g1]|nr:hypothetical protein MYOV072v1_p0044 [Vibrio phage 207E29.1]
MEKKCFKCGETKPLTEFYKHKQMKDGHVNKCKSCNKSDVSRHRSENIEKIRKYDRERGNRQPDGYIREWREKYPKKYRAQLMVNNHKRAGNLHQEPCEICGSSKSVAHHDDYDKPLNVRWLCQAHHKQWHAKNGEGKNAI